MMANGIIRDPITGHQIAYADASGKVRDVTTNAVVAVIGGPLLSRWRISPGILESSDEVGSGPAPMTFVKLMKKNQ